MESYIASFLAGLLLFAAGVLVERVRMNRIINASMVRLPGLKHRIAIIKEDKPLRYTHPDEPAPITIDLTAITYGGNDAAR